MAYTFFSAQGLGVGRSHVEEDKMGMAMELLFKAKEKGIDFRLPIDHVAATEIVSGIETKIIDSFPFPPDMMALDIGPDTVGSFTRIISGAKTILWNGPLGVFEIDDFANGTMKIAEAVAEADAVSIVGGGDSVAAVYKAGVSDKISHISTGGGASLEYIADETLPGLEALSEK